jgi:hypothetical protein
VTRLGGAALVVLVVLAAGCARDAAEVVSVHVVVSPEAGVELGELSVEPRAALAGRWVDGRTATLSFRGRGAVTLSAPFACPLVLELGKSAGAVVRLEPLFDVGPARRVVGFEHPFEVVAKAGCGAASGASVALSLAGGAALASAGVVDGGARLVGKTAAPPPLAPGLTAGIVPVADADRGVTHVDVATRLGDGRVGHRTVEIAATTRASGLANVAVDHRVLLRGDGLHLTDRPPESRAELRAVGGLFELVPDVPGRFVLEGVRTQRTVVQSGRYDETPLDCGRADCHRDLSESALASPMTHAYANDLAGARALVDPACAVSCHTTGEPGVKDGGFSHVWRELGEPSAHGFSELPRALRRLGGVGCLACHGPGAIPEPSSRFALLGRGVCGVCHDSPPAYGHARAFASTRMASSDHDPRTLEKPCARCHTTFGALGRDAHRPPPGVELGLGCAVCHDVHPHGPGATARAVPSLLRELPLPESLGELPASMLGPSRVCLSCHAPSREGSPPEASAAALVLARGGTEPRTGAPLTSAAPHATALAGCLSCHGSGPEGLGRGAAHAFSVAPNACSSCHAPRPRDPSLAARARALLGRLGGTLSLSDAPLHATPGRTLADASRARAFANVALVLEDPAADVHNPRYAAHLLDAAEAALASPPSALPLVP